MDTNQRQNLAAGIRAVLNAKRERLLARPIIAQVAATAPEGHAQDSAATPDVFRTLQRAARDRQPASLDIWREDPTDGTCRVRIVIDYEDKWRGCEKEVLESIKGMIEGAITFLTEQQKLLLERAPHDFLALSPGP
ncbi:MAG TPA: hypothetical protein PKA88_36490, partial [Polyangiaceae bacterium]|nr:hypothetical protein [Polyangiaceae bacterium]